MMSISGNSSDIRSNSDVKVIRCSNIFNMLRSRKRERNIEICIHLEIVTLLISDQLLIHGDSKIHHASEN